MSLNYFDGTNLQNIAGAKTIEVDDVPTANSENPVSSGGVYSALKTFPFEENTFSQGSLNNFPYGIAGYAPSNADIPTANDYGVCLTIKFSDGMGGSNWIYQTAYSTGGNIYKRRKIDAGTWTAWVEL